MIAHKMVRDKPSISNFTAEISKKLFELPDLNKENFCESHIDNFIKYAANKCILNSIKTVRNIFKKKHNALKNNKTPVYHYKLRHLIDK